jgi:hypothetical protein
MMEQVGIPERSKWCAQVGELLMSHLDVGGLMGWE